MSSIIHARLDADTDAVRKGLQQQLGWSDSQIVREGIKSLVSLIPMGRRRKIKGLGRFQSQVSDLGTDKKHLKGFGK